MMASLRSLKVGCSSSGRDSSVATWTGGSLFESAEVLVPGFVLDGGAMKSNQIYLVLGDHSHQPPCVGSVPHCPSPPNNHKARTRGEFARVPDITIN